MRYRGEGVPTIVIAGKEYGTGSSRDWAGKGPRLLGVRAVIAQSFERIHRSNLVGMGVVPLQFLEGQGAESLGLDGQESYTIHGLAAGLANNFKAGRELAVAARGPRARRGRVPRPRAHRHTPGNGVRQARWHPPLRPPATGLDLRPSRA